MRHRLSGQAMTEYIIVFPVMIILVFGALQIALLWHAKIQVNYAAFEAARTGALHHAQQWALQAGTVRGLAPLHTHQRGDGFNSGVAFLRWARSKVWADLDAGLISIQRISPNAAAFDAHGIDIDVDGNAVRAIPNDHLMYRDATPDGTPAVSIQDANLLKVRVIYCYEMYVPFVNRMINALLRLPAQVNAGSGTVGTGQLQLLANSGVNYTAPAASPEFLCLNYHNTIPQNWRRYIPVVGQSVIRMQSDAWR